MTRIIFSADLHGNLEQYEKLADYANVNFADSVIIGGDLAPKGFSVDEYIAGQADFFKEQFPSLISRINAQVFLMMGNDDVKVNEELLKANDGELYDIIHDQRIPLGRGFDIAGYSCVPITPFGIKDWEKYDLVNIPEDLKTLYAKVIEENYRLYGVKSISGSWEPFEFVGGFEDSIQNDLESEVFTKNTNKLVFVSHSPPQGIHDVCLDGKRVGSLAVFDYIRNHNPYLTLHGHIHETVHMTGSFKTHYGKTSCLTSGNHNESDSVALLDLELEHPRNAVRHVI